MIGIHAHRTVYRVMVGGVLAALFACFNRTGELSPTADLEQYEFPTIVEDLFDMLRDIDDLAGGNDLIISMHVAIV